MIAQNLQASRLRGRRASPLIELPDLDDFDVFALGFESWGLGLECGHLQVYLSNLLVEHSQLFDVPLLLVTLKFEQTRPICLGWLLNREGRSCLARHVVRFQAQVEADRLPLLAPLAFL